MRQFHVVFGADPLSCWKSDAWKNPVRFRSASIFIRTTTQRSVLVVSPAICPEAEAYVTPVANVARPIVALRYGISVIFIPCRSTG